MSDRSWKSVIKELQGEPALQHRQVLLRLAHGALLACSTNRVPWPKTGSSFRTSPTCG